MKILLVLLSIVLTYSVPSTGADSATAVFAGGCFWCMESDFQDTAGVIDVVSGFTGGESKNPTYDGDHRGHYEAIKITYDPSMVSYSELLTRYWHNVDPFDDGGQFCDRGHSYQAALFPQNAEQTALAEQSRQEVVAQFPQQSIVTEVLPASAFWPVKDYHQDYYQKNPVRYKYYRWSCGRDGRLEEIWGKG